jgi:hypothetical protein
MKSTIRITALALMIAFPLSGFAKCPKGTQGSSNFDEAQATFQRFGEKLDAGVKSTGTWTSVATKVSHGMVSKSEPAEVLFANDGGKLKITAVVDPGTKIENKLGPYETEICSGGGKITAVFLKTPMGELPIEIALDDTKGITLATSIGDLNIGHLAGAQ